MVGEGEWMNYAARGIRYSLAMGGADLYLEYYELKNIIMIIIFFKPTKNISGLENWLKYQ